MSKLYLTAAAALVTLAFAAPIAPESLPGSLGPRDNPYTMYTGDGSSGDGWPTSDSWPDYETMFSNNAPLMGISCTEFGQDNNSPDETQAIHDSVLSVAGSSGVDPRFILAIVIQESKGCVRVPSTSGVNPGLMQDANGSGTCNVGGVGVQPCPNDQISQMVTDGATGTASGNGLQQWLAQASSGSPNGQQTYMAARMYNSGSVDASGDLGIGIGTQCYASDIANRLAGWVDSPSGCTLST